MTGTPPHSHATGQYHLIEPAESPKELETNKTRSGQTMTKPSGCPPQSSNCRKPTKKSKALKYLIRAERNRQCYANFQQHTKPKTAGGLAFVTITKEDRTKQPLLDTRELEDTLLEHSRAHFAQANGSRFTQEPLKHLLQYDGLMTFGNHVTQGKPLPEVHHFDEPTAAVLTNLK